MDEILIKAGGFLFMIALGFVLKRIGLFSLDDSGFLSKLVLKVTLPMAIIKNFQGLELNRSYLMAIGIGFAVNFIAIAVVMLLTRKKSPAHRAFYIINTAGFNIGLCTLPYMSSFFAADAVALVCMFDVGNAIMCFGITFSIAMVISKGSVNGKEIFLYAVCDLFGDDFALCGANPSATARLHGCRDDWTGKLLSCNAFNRDFV